MIRSAFFGTRPLAHGVLSELAAANLSPVRSIESARMSAEFITELSAEGWDVFIVASFGVLLPKSFLTIPKHGVLNVHPSLLPRLRGPSPIRSAILQDERETGVSIMLLDEKMDHGPLIAQRKVALPDWPPHGRDLDDLMAHEGGKLLAEVLPLWTEGELQPKPQNHDLATYCREFVKEDGLLDLRADPYQTLLKVRALEGWPGTYTFFERADKPIRVQILDAHMEGGKLMIDVVKPEGKREMSYEDFLRSGAKLA